MTDTLRRLLAEATPSGDDWPRCRECRLYQSEHGGERHQFLWPSLTQREVNVLNRIVAGMRLGSKP